MTPIRKKWKSEMTDRERFVNQMHFKPVDRCFNMEFGYWDENFTVWDMFRKNGIKNNGDADRFFSFDRFEEVWGNVWISPGFSSETVSETATHKIILDYNGVLQEIKKDGTSSIPRYIGSSADTPDKWLKIKTERFNPDSPERRIDLDALRERHKPNRDYPLGVNCGSMIGRIRDMLTFEGLAYACCDYPEMVEDMVETCCVLIENFLDQVLGVIDFDFAGGWEDICFNHGPIVTLDFFRDIVTPRYKRINKKLIEHGIDLWYTDCDGDVRPILPCLLDGGINCLFPFEVNSCAHPAQLCDEYGNALHIMGGFDKMKLGAGRQAIEEYMQSIIPLVNRGGYIPFCDHRCPPNVTQEDYLYYLDLKEDTFGLK